MLVCLFYIMENKNNNTQKVQPIPEGMNSVTPFLPVKDAEGLIEFIKKAFDGRLTYILKEEDNKVMHATMKVGNSIIMLCDVMPPQEPMPCQLYLYVKDADAVFRQAISAGGSSIREPLTEFYGDRSGGVKDKWGNHWWIATHVEDVSEEEIRRRSKEFMKQMAEK